MILGTTLHLYHFLHDYGLRDIDSISMVDVAVVKFRYNARQSQTIFYIATARIFYGSGVRPGRPNNDTSVKSLFIRL